MSVPSPKAFAAPWEAQVFALVVSLQEAGLFTWAEWAERIGREIRPDDGPERAADYGAWLATLEQILAQRGVAPPSSVAARAEAFLRAAAATPHGQPIHLENDPLYRS
ncbi:nitrile hydratase accessory protein [Methylobacterium sp. WL64]|uniref:nitrile hydratase accessory protein n=1 Tax=Methylobacterium sp. WL64 TaxID=2603894 RepID=UPI0011C98D76|nr:nitrile hydratase accessory protein [Methylobacterium sp. WL64]TXN05071.1 nitrile hydratase accessory protein [Methylobacterium sp. WL64]